MQITWSLVINILHAIIEILCRVAPGEDINGAKADIADAVAQLWSIHTSKGKDDGESQSTTPLG